MLCAALRREGEHGDARLRLKERPAGIGGGDGDLGEFRHRRLDDDAAVGVDERTVCAEVRAGQNHDEEAGDDTETGADADAVERGAHGVGGRVRRARDRAVGLAFAHEEVAVVERVADGEARLVGHQALRAPQLVVNGRDPLEVGRAAVVE